MTDRRCRGWRCFNLALLSAVFVVQAAAARPAPVPGVEQANLRWKNARCRLRLPLIIGKKKNSEGWSYSPWYEVAGSKPVYHYRFYVSDRQRIAHLLDGKTLRVGTTFISRGWRMKESKKSRSLWLDLQFADLPVDAHIEVWLKHPDENFALAERYMRVTAFQIQAMDEQLVDVPTTSVTSQAVPVDRSRPPPEPPQPVVSEPTDPELQIVAVAVQPARVPPGGEVTLVITYEVSGVPPGPGFEVLERREILRGGQRLAGFEERLQRTNDVITSSQPLSLPPDVAPGIYTLWAEVVMAGGKTTGTALFEVVTTP